MRVAGCGRSSSRSRRRRRTSYPIASPFANHSDESGTVCSQKHTLAFCLVFNFLLLSILTFSRRSITHSQFTQFRLFLYGTIGLRCRRFYAILEQCRRVHGVDLGESFQTHIYLQNLASIQPRTSPLKFAVRTCYGPTWFFGVCIPSAAAPLRRRLAAQRDDLRTQGLPSETLSTC